MSKPANSPIVIVTGVGALIGQGIISSLRAVLPDAWVIGVDRSSDSPGPYICNEFHQKPNVREDDDRYGSFWLELLSISNTGIVLPGIDIDCCYLSSHRELLTQTNAVLALNSPSLIEICSDKLSLYEATKDLEVACIPTIRADHGHENFAAVGPTPFILKMRFGSGSRGLRRLDDKEQLDQLAKSIRLDDYILQPYIGCDESEFTAAAFGYGDGTASNVITFRRTLSALGNTAKAVVCEVSQINYAVEVLTKHFKPLGPTNYQFRMHEDKYYLLEINPRFSSSSSLRTHFGFNEVQMTIDFYLHQKRNIAPAIRQGRAWRYFADYVVYDSPAE